MRFFTCNRWYSNVGLYLIGQPLCTEFDEIAPASICDDYDGTLLSGHLTEVTYLQTERNVVKISASEVLVCCLVDFGQWPVMEECILGRSILIFKLIWLSLSTILISTKYLTFDAEHSVGVMTQNQSIVVAVCNSALKYGTRLHQDCEWGEICRNKFLLPV